MKYYNFCIFHSVQKNLVAQTGDPEGTGHGGASIFQLLYGSQARFFEMELKPKIRHRRAGLVSMVNNGHNQHGSQFFITLADDLDYLDGSHTVFGEVREGLDVVEKINESFCDKENRPYRNIRIYRTPVLEDPFPDPPGLSYPDRSPKPTEEQMTSDRIEADDELDEFQGMSKAEIEEVLADREAKANAQILEIIGDLPSADVRPDEATLFVCKLNPVTTSEDLNIIFSRFGEIISCEVIKDPKTNNSLQYAFIEYARKADCEEAFFKMENVLIDDRRIHVDFSQSVAKEWHKYRAKPHGESITTRRENALVLKDFGRRDKDKYAYVFDEKDKRRGKLDKQKSPSPHRRRNDYDSRDLANKNRRRHRSSSEERPYGKRKWDDRDDRHRYNHRDQRKDSSPPRSRQQHRRH